MKQLFTKTLLATLMGGVIALSGCSQPTSNDSPGSTTTSPSLLVPKERLAIYHEVPLTADLTHLSENQRAMLSLLIDASVIMDNLFWQQAFHENKTDFLASLTDPAIRRFADINYGPWDRLNGDRPFLSGYEEKAPGAEFYPHDITKDAFNKASFADKDGLYSIVRYDDAGNLTSIPYSEAYAAPLQKAAELLRKASELADNPAFANYLSLRADALLSDDYLASDMAWMDMKTNPIELVIGPIESYEDQLFGYRAAFEAYVLIKDMAWSEKLAKYAQFLPELQRWLCCPHLSGRHNKSRHKHLNLRLILEFPVYKHQGQVTRAAVQAETGRTWPAFRSRPYL